MMMMFDKKVEKSNHLQVTGELVGGASLASSR